MIYSLNDIQDHAEFDSVIVGAGMVGASAALGLARAGQRVLLIEAFPLAFPLPAYTPSYDARSTALSWGSRMILEELGVWRDISTHAMPINKVHVSQKGRFGTTQMTADETGQASLGYVVPNQWLGQCLLESILKTEHISLCSPARITKVQTQNNLRNITIAADGKEKQISTSLLVVADGNKSESARLLGIEQKISDYGQHAIIANVTTELPNEGIAYERFTSKGPIALLPLNEFESALVWTHDSAEVENTLSLSDDDFCSALEDEFGDRMGRIVRCGQRDSYPLKLVLAEEQVRPGVVLLGNAAHSLHPVAGQGFNLALRGVAMLVEKLMESPDQLSALNHYYQQQSADQKRTILGSDQLVKMFGHSSTLLAMARDLGLVSLNNTPFLKQAFAKTAMGLAERKANMPAGATPKKETL